MRTAAVRILLLMTVIAAFANKAWPSSLRVSPSTLELVAPARVGTLTLRNGGAAPAHYQIRVYRWSQRNGAEHLEPATQVVASPPITKVDPGRDYTVRILRLGERPLTAEESYRLYVDELPVRARQANGTVAFLLRYSVPVFFTAAPAVATPLEWEAGYRSGQFILTARNPGPARARVGAMTLRDARGRGFTLAKGLAGYVLSGARHEWRFDARRLPGLTPGPARLTFQTDTEAIDVQVLVPGRR